MDDGNMEVQMATLVARVEQMVTDVHEIRRDVKLLRDESPIWRISQLEKWRDAQAKFIVGLILGLLVALAGNVLNWIF